MKMWYNYYFFNSFCLFISKVEWTLSERFMSSTTRRTFSEIKRQAAALGIKPSRRKLQGFYQQDRQSIETSSEPTFRRASGNVENLYAMYRFSSYLHNSQYVLLLGWTIYTVHNCAGDVAGHNQSKTINMLNYHIRKQKLVSLIIYSIVKLKKFP